MHVVLGLNYRALIFNPELQPKLDRSLHALASHRQGTYVPPGNNIIHSAHYPKDDRSIELALHDLLQAPSLTCDIEGFSLDFDKAGIGTIAFADGTTFDLFGFTGSPPGTNFSTVVSTGSGSYSGLTFSGLGGVWTALLGSQTLTFSELSGLLSFQNSSAPVPEIDPTSFGSALTLLIGSLGLLERRARRRTRS